MRNRDRPVAAMRLGSRAQDCKLALGLARIGEKGRGQGSCCRQLREQQADTLGLGKRGVIEVRLHEAEHLADSALVHVRVLTQIERGEMKLEDIDGAAHVFQVALGQNLRAIGDERGVDDC